MSDVKKFHEACWKHLIDSGRECRRIGYEFDFPRDEVFVFLRQRKRTLSLHTLHDFIGMEKHENFNYEVLFGDKNAISQMLNVGADAGLVRLEGCPIDEPGMMFGEKYRPLGHGQMTSPSAETVPAHRHNVHDDTSRRRTRQHTPDW
jgi:hypothetical protein